MLSEFIQTERVSEKAISENEKQKIQFEGNLIKENISKIPLNLDDNILNKLPEALSKNDKIENVNVNDFTLEKMLEELRK
jgi:hypothetical protein